jgi:O-antigen ligase
MIVGAVRVRGTVDAVLGICVGLIAALITLAAGLAGHVEIALALPFAILIVALVAVRPEVGMLILIFISYLDGISDMVMRGSPISGFKLFTAVTILGLLLTAHRNGDHFRALLGSRITRLGLLFLMIWALAILSADSRAAAITWGSRIFTIILIMFLVLAALRTQRFITLAIWCLALTSLISGLVVIFDTLFNTTLIATSEAATTARTSGGFDRSSGASQYNPTTAATLLLTGTLVALVHGLESPRFRTFFVACALVGTLAIALSFARSAALVYAIVICVIAVRYGKHRHFGAAMIFATVAALAMLPLIPTQYFDRLASIFDGGGDWTLGRRLTYNVIGIDLVKSNPFLGIGPGNFFQTFTDPEFRYLPGRTLGGRQLHNMYLSVAVEYGMLGFGVFMALIWTGFRMCRDVAHRPANEDMRALAVALSFGMLGYYLTSLFLPNEYNKYTWLLPGLSGALFLINQRLLKQR